MAIRSMTGYAQVKGQSGQESAPVSFSLSLKAVNHRFLDLNMRLPAESDALEMKLRRLLKEKMARGHLDVTLTLERTGSDLFSLNRELVGGYLRVYRAAAQEFGVTAEPDLNAVFKLPGALMASAASLNGDSGYEAAVLGAAEQAIANLDRMRTEEGASIERELRERMAHLAGAADEVEKLRAVISRAHLEKITGKLQELVGSIADPARILQEAAILAERSDVQEEIVRMKAHVGHFLGLMKAEGEIGKKLDFLLQEMNREANTLLSKTAGLAGEGLRITELGLAMKSEIEKAREQVQNVE
ncbi:MAG TPA: YicC/YloC family endoribonuclease [Terriglobales bacterium]|nr:YicC/YloC family endoribonuclease [Terriglobales bacterium]